MRATCCYRHRELGGQVAHVEIAHQRIADLAQHLGHALSGGRLAGNGRVVGGALDQVVEHGPGLLDQRAKSLGTALAHELVRVHAGGHLGHPPVRVRLGEEQPRLDRDRHRLLGRAPPGTIAVEDDDDTFGHAPEQRDLLDRQGSAHRRHDLLDAGFMERKYVEVSLDHDGNATFANGIDGGVQPVQVLLLVKQR